MSAMLAIAIKDLRTFTPPARLAVLHVHLAALRGGPVRRAVRRQRQADAAAAHRGGGRGQDRRLTRLCRSAGRARHLRRQRRGQPRRSARGGAQGRADRGGHAAAWLRRGVLADVLRHAARGAALHGPEPAGRARHARGPADAAGRRADAGDVLQSDRRARERAEGTAGSQEGRTWREPRPRDVPRATRHVPRHARRGAAWLG